MQPRLIRLRDVPLYLGMDKNRFNTEVRPYLMTIPIGNHGIAFDRLDLDAWIDRYKKCNGCALLRLKNAGRHIPALLNRPLPSSS